LKGRPPAAPTITFNDVRHGWKRLRKNKSPSNKVDLSGFKAGLKTMQLMQRLKRRPTQNQA
jgi:hypothetical protein